MERNDGVSSNSPTSSFSMEVMEPHLLGEFGNMEGFGDVFYVPEYNNYDTTNELGYWTNLYDM